MTVQCCPLSGTDDGERCQAFTSSTRTARKEHSCCECGYAIYSGARYEYVSGIWGDRPDSYKTCLSCVEIRDHFACNGFLFGYLWDDLESNYFRDMKAGGPCMDGLSPAAKARLFERRLNWLEQRR